MNNNLAILKKYDTLCATPSDINELLPFLRFYAEKCKHITEMGIRTPTSTYAFLAGEPKTLISYDINRVTEVGEVESLARGVFKFVQQDVLNVEIEETDFLFIDTYHTATQLENELKMHSNKVRKYIGLHDTSTFWEHGEELSKGMDPKQACGRGLKFALKPFLKKGQWKIAFATDKNNGLIILERKRKNWFVSSQLGSHLKYTFYLNSRKLRYWILRLTR